MNKLLTLKEIRTKLNKEQANGHAKLEGAGRDLERLVAYKLRELVKESTTVALHHKHKSGCDLLWQLSKDEEGLSAYLDVKTCRASSHGGNIFLERSSWNREANHFAHPLPNKYLLYVDIGTGQCYTISTMKIAQNFMNIPATSRGGDSAYGYKLNFADPLLEAQLLLTI